MSQRSFDVSADANASPLQAHTAPALYAQEQDRSLNNDDTTSTTVDENRSLQVPLDVSTSRPDSPVNKKRTDDDDAEILNRDGARGHHPSLPPSKKSKTSPVLQPQDDSMVTAFKDTDANVYRQTAGSFVDATQVANSVNPDVHSGVSGVDVPVLRHSATAILESLSKPGENSLGNLNLGTPTARHDHTGDRVMGVITSRPGSRQTSPDIDTTDQMADQSPKFTRAMLVSSDDDETLQHSSIAEAMMHDDVHNAGEPDQVFEQAVGSDSDGYDSDSMDDIDVEYHGMMDSDVESEGSPYEDPDPQCLDRLTDEETEIIMDEARMHGVSYIIQKYILSGLMSAKKMLLMTISGQIEIPEGFTENDVIRAMQQQLKRFLRRRKRLEHIHSLEAVVDLLKTSKKIMVLTGAGVSVSCGIPDFRSEDGIYSRLSEFELDDPQQMFDLDFFRERPEIFFSFAREIFPSNFVPSPSHYFIKLLEDKGKLLRNYAQNIDALEQQAGIERVLQCHGSFATASCVRCGFQVKGDDIKESIFKQEVAYCTRCKKPTPPPQKKKSKARYSSSDEDESDDEEDPHGALMKPDIVFFGEKLPPVFDQRLKEDKQEVDLLIVIGSSLKVAPVSDIMHQLPNSVPQILINRTPNYQMAFDVQLLGNCDTIVAELCRMAGWELKHTKLPGGTSNVPDMETNTNADGSGKGGRAAWTFMEPNTYLFEGALLEELDFEAVKEKSRNRALGEQERGSNEGEEGSEEEDQDDDDVASLDGEEVEGYHHNDEEEESDSEINTALQHAHTSSDPRPGQASVVGIASGTTLPRSGSITDIHQLHSSGGSNVSDMNSSDSSLTETAATGLLRQIHFTESMPRDIDETLVRNGDGAGQQLDPAHVLQHSRKPSADLCPITEDTLLEVDVDDDEDSLTGKGNGSGIQST